MHDMSEIEAAILRAAEKPGGMKTVRRIMRELELRILSEIHTDLPDGSRHQAAEKVKETFRIIHLAMAKFQELSEVTFEDEVSGDGDED